jgi:hypothetical protein
MRQRAEAQGDAGSSPKTEGRRPKEGRDPKSESTRARSSRFRNGALSDSAAAGGPDRELEDTGWAEWGLRAWERFGRPAFVRRTS